MSLSTLKPVVYRIPPVAGTDRALSKVSKVTMMNRQTPAPLQVKAKEKSVLQQSLSATSRREMLHFTAASVGLFSLLLPAPAEAVAKDTPLSKIMELLEELRQNVGLAEPKPEGQDTKPKDEMDGKSKISHTNTAQEMNVAPSEGAVIPAVPGMISGKTVEATLP